MKGIRTVCFLVYAPAVLLGGCVPSSALRPTDTISELGGRVFYEARTPTARGASAALSLQPARLVDVFARDSDGETLARGVTDRQGRFRFAVPEGVVELVAVAHIGEGELELAVTEDGLGRRAHSLTQKVMPHTDPLDYRLIARELSPDGVAGAFHILDTLLRGVEAVHSWVDRTLPPLFVYWRRGGPHTWSYYRGERPPGSGRFCLELMGGERGRQHTTDTDEHDEHIIMHELGHFVMDRLSTDSSPGGDHPAGHLLDPGLAWEEGRATWFAAAVLGDPNYRDTIGVEPQGRLRVNRNIEAGARGLRGMGSEAGVSEILWDLTDGGDVEDTDSDGISLGPAAVFGAMLELAEDPGAYPAIHSYLRFLLDRQVVGRNPLKLLLARGGHPSELLPPSGEEIWPVDVPMPGQVSGKIDGLSEPAPSGGPRRSANGIDAVHVYRVRLTERGRIYARLRIFGSGRAADHEDLDLELRDIRANLIGRSNGEDVREVVSRMLDAGFYTLYVRDGGSGNRVGYELRVSH